MTPSRTRGIEPLVRVGPDFEDEYPGADASWDAEFAHVLDCIATGTPVNGGLEDAVAALRIVETLYAMSPALGEPLGAVKS